MGALEKSGAPTSLKGATLANAPIRPNLPSNSKLPERKKVEQVTTATVTKKKSSFGTKAISAFVGEDIHNVGEYLLYDVTIPAIKNTLSDLVSQGIERLLFGESSPRARSSSGGSRVSYGSYSRPGSAPGNKRDASPRSRRYHDFSEIELESRDEAYLVIDRLGDIIEEYGLATVADLYDLCGISTEYTDENWGWTSARYMSVIRSRRGYMLQLPKPDHINAR